MELPAYCSKEGIGVYHFDFEKNLSTPKLTTSEAYYTRFLYCYSFGIYCGMEDKTVLYMYEEYKGKKTSNDVASMLHHFFSSHPYGRTGVKHVALFADNCGGTNKNHLIMQLMDYIVQKGMFETVSVYFLSSGHSFGPADRAFAQVENAGRAADRIDCPEDWMDLVEKVNNIGQCTLVYKLAALILPNYTTSTIIYNLLYE